MRGDQGAVFGLGVVLVDGWLKEEGEGLVEGKEEGLGVKEEKEEEAEETREEEEKAFFGLGLRPSVAIRCCSNLERRRAAK